MDFKLNSSWFGKRSVRHIIDKPASTRYNKLFRFIERYCREADHNLTWYRGQRDVAPDNAPFCETSISFHTKVSGHNHWNAKVGHLAEEYFTFDSTGWSGWSSVCDTPIDYDSVDMAAATTLYDHIYNKYVVGNRSKYKQPQLGEVPEKDYLLMLGQIPTDTVGKHSYFRTSSAAFRRVLKTLRDDVDILVKLHPKAGPQKLMRRFIRNHKRARIVDGSIHSLIKNSRGVVVVNSGTGFEALLHLKHVFTLGKCDYQHVTHKIDSVDAIASIPSLLDTPVDTVKLKKFLYYYLTRFNVCIENYAAFKKSFERIMSL